MCDLVGNPEDRVSHDISHTISGMVEVTFMLYIISPPPNSSSHNMETRPQFEASSEKIGI